MIGSLIKIELLKVKRKGLWFLVFLGAFGVISLQAVNYGVRYDYLITQYDNQWDGVFKNVNMFLPVAVLLGSCIVASMMAGIEHTTNAWKQIFALPVKKRDVYFAKYFVLFMMILTASFLVWIGTALLGLGLGFGPDVPWMAAATNSFFPMLAAMPILALQLWLSMTFDNQGISLTVGILGMIVAMFGGGTLVADWVIWTWANAYPWEESLQFVWLGIALGIALYVAGALDFSRRERK
ncbi:ABC transporter permease [Bacillus gobiensis]|uniref:ABC transporter permease n=1 Tax=Bacillus gobiensis TaxID=1441095 RepID=UPI003D1CB03C